jgi:hypothetical protein
MPVRTVPPPAGSTPRPRIHDRLVADLGTAIGSLKQGDPQQEETELGR